MKLSPPSRHLGMLEAREGEAEVMDPVIRVTPSLRPDTTSPFSP